MPSALAESLLEKLKDAGLKLAVAESLTGGMLTSEFASISGASDVLLGGVVAYNNNAKRHLLGVSSESLANFGAVSQEVALEMAQGAQGAFAGANGVSVQRVVSVSTTGVAGPAESEGKAVGTVFIAACAGSESIVKAFHFDGARPQVREAACQAAMEMLLSLLTTKN